MQSSIFTLSFFVSLIASTIRLATPILIPALGQIYTQRAGILNLGVEGTMLMGAITAFSVAAGTGNLWLGVLAGIAAGVIFTIPAFFLWGAEISKLEITLMAVIGGLIGVIFMIPLRRSFISKEHGKLPYPEGTACAEVLVSGQGDVSKAKTLFWGMGIGALYQALMHGNLWGLWNKEIGTAIPGYKKAEIYVNKRIKYALGGGNCQVSTTLYNAVLAVPGLDITERHEHNGRSVDYIEDGKDATVSYNTLDLKFVNNTGKAVKLYTSIDDSNVYARITEIE